MNPTRKNPPSATNAERAEDISADSVKSSHMIPQPAGSPQEAGRRCDQIRVLLTSMTEQTINVGDILEEAQTNLDHAALGYSSWTTYLAGEYAGLLADLSRAHRREVVGSLTAIGMSTRAIAQVVGVSRQQVSTDLHVASNLPPGREDEDDVDHRVTGMDGKSYTVPNQPTVEPRKPHRTSLPDHYRAAVQELDNVVRRMEKLHTDDRFAHHRESFGHHHRLLLELADKVGVFALEVSDGHADRVVVEMSSEGGLR